jgi:Raf kinase inhibitor-like YbhB/YbcL family protein
VKPASPPPFAHITVSSPDLPGTVPKQFTCDGGSHIPRIRWTAVAVTEWALEMVDPDAPGGEFVHWVVYGIPAGTTAVGPELPAGALQGKNGRGQAGYTGPCPPPGPAHHYHFIV